MKLNEKTTLCLRNAIDVVKMLGVETIMISEGKIRGAKASLDAAIISDLDLGLPDDVNIAIGRIDELSSRLSAFDSSTIEIETNQNNDATSLTIKAPRTKLSFRCTAPTMIRYPKSNDDDPIARITMTSSEVKTLVKAVSITSAEHVVIQMNRDSSIRIEALDLVRDQFEMVLENNAQTVDEANSFVFTYLGKLLTKALSGAATGDSPVTIVVGESGSITLSIRDHTVILYAHMNEDDEENY